MRSRPAGRGIEVAAARFTRHRFSPHRHDTYAVGITLQGVQEFTYRGVVRRSLPGDVFVLHPDEVHDGAAGTEEGYAYRIVYLDPSRVLAALETRTLPFVRDCVGSHPALKAALGDVFHAAEEERAEADALGGLADALAAAAGQPPAAVIDETAMARVRERLRSADVVRPSMRALESETGLTRFALSRQFKARYGVAPSRFLTMRRLDRARRAILAGDPLADAAAASGFSDQSHLTRVFKRAYGVTPARWRSLVAAGKPS